MKILNFRIKKEHIIGLAVIGTGIYLATRRKEPETPKGIVDKVSRQVNRYFPMKKTATARTKTTTRTHTGSDSVHRLFARGGTVGAAKYALSDSKVISDAGGVIKTRKGGYTYDIHTVKTGSGRQVTGVTVHTPYKLGGLPYSYHVGESWVAGL